MSQTLSLSPEIQEAVESFIEYHDPARTSIHLRCMLMEAMKHELLIDELYFKDLMYDLDGIFELLSAMSETSNARKDGQG